MNQNQSLEYDIEHDISRGEDSSVQFKENVYNSSSLAEEFVAFSNAIGGKILIGIDDNGEVTGLSDEDINRLNQLISNTSSEMIKPPINVLSKIHTVNNKNILVVIVKEGLSKPYSTNEGKYITKSGADKRKLSQDELLRLFQESGKISGDEVKITGTSVDDINLNEFVRFLKEKYQLSIESTDIDEVKRYLKNLNLLKDEELTLAGILTFAKTPQEFRPAFNIKAVSFYGTERSDSSYRDSEDINGNLQKMYEDGMSFLNRNLRKVQKDQGFNSEGIQEIPAEVLQENLINALIHRDYLITSPIKLFIFDDRVEIISPGKLPNSLTIEMIKNGISVMRNPIIVSIATKILPYKGIGSGIMRSLKLYPHIEYKNLIEEETFITTIKRVYND